MRISSILACAAVISLSPLAFGAVNFFEGFESPAGDPFVAVPTSGAQSFDNPGWVVINTADPLFGVYLTTLPGLSAGTGQSLAFGGGQAPGPNQVSILVSGFTNMDLPSIKYDHIVDATPLLNPLGQTTTITVTDPSNGDAVIYQRTVSGLGVTSIDESFDSSPTGDTVVVTISQSGISDDSDAAVDNLEITAVPEPAVTLLAVLGILAGVTRRRR